MSISVFENHGLQLILDLSEDVIGNNITVMNAEYRLLAYTRNIPIDDDITNYLISYGKHSDKTIERFIELRRIEEFEKIDDLIVTTDHELCKYETVKRVFHGKESIHYYVVMHCNRKLLSLGLLGLFRYMLGYIKRYTDKNCVNPYQFTASLNFLRELLGKEISTIDEAITKAEYVSIPFQKKYYLFEICFQDEFNVPLEIIVLQLREYLSVSYVLLFNRRIVVLWHVKEQQKQAEIKEKMRQIAEKLLKDTPCTVGMSNMFDNLWQITAAMEQAGCAIEYGTHVERNVQKRKSVLIFDFEECFLTLIVAKTINGFPELFCNCFTLCAIEKLLNYDLKHGTSLLKTLETYLSNEKKMTEVGQKLHMHRNTVIYQIERIETILEVSLHDVDVCMKLQIGLLMYQTNMQQLAEAAVVHRGKNI